MMVWHWTFQKFVVRSFKPGRVRTNRETSACKAGNVEGVPFRVLKGGPYLSKLPGSLKSRISSYVSAWERMSKRAYAWSWDNGSATILTLLVMGMSKSRWQKFERLNWSRSACHRGSEHCGRLTHQTCLT